MNTRPFKAYRELGVPKTLVSTVQRLNQLPTRKLNNLAQPIRKATVNEAISWPTGKNQDKRITTVVYKIDNYTIGVEKPGKEAAPGYTNGTDYITKKKTNNPNDMLPILHYKGKRNDNVFSFFDLFSGIENLMRADIFGLEILGMLVFRMAFVLDHKEVKEGQFRLNINPENMDILKKRIPSISLIPTDVYLHYLELLALNEDVKYHTLNYNPEFKQDYGRVNTLLTLVNLISVLLQRKSIAEFAGSFARPPVGISAIQKTKIAVYFPLFSYHEEYLRLE